MSFLQQETHRFSSADLSNSVSLPVYESAAADNCEKFVAFLLGGGVFCVSSQTVLEVIHPLPVSCLPNAPSAIAGIAAFRGEVVAVVNITEILGLSEPTAGSKSKFVILRAGHKDTQFAIPVDSMYELIAVPPGTVAAHPDAPDSLTRKVEYEGNVFKLIDIEALMERLEKSIG